MDKWEYLSVTGYRSGEDLNKLGEHGWELVTAYRSGDFLSSTHNYVFKRRKTQ